MLHNLWVISSSVRLPGGGFPEAHGVCSARKPLQRAFPILLGRLSHLNASAGFAPHDRPMHMIFPPTGRRRFLLQKGSNLRNHGPSRPLNVFPFHSLIPDKDYSARRAGHRHGSASRSADRFVDAGFGPWTPGSSPGAPLPFERSLSPSSINLNPYGRDRRQQRF